MSAEAFIKAHEGYKPEPYRDHLGIWTTGHGINIDSKPIPSFVSTCGELLNWLSDPHLHERWFQKRFDEAQRGAKVFAGDAWNSLSEPRQNVLIELCYWIGYPRLTGFKRFRKALKAGKWVSAEQELLDSRLYRQVPGRTKDLANRFLEG